MCSMTGLYLLIHTNDALLGREVDIFRILVSHIIAPSAKITHFIGALSRWDSEEHYKTYFESYFCVKAPYDSHFVSRRLPLFAAILVLEAS